MKKLSMRKTSVTVALAAGLALAGSVQAQHVQVRADNVESARNNLEKSVKAAARGQKVGMVSGRVNPQAQRQADGSVVQELDAGTMSYSVARRNADGSIEMVCVNGAEAAEKAMKAPTTFAKRVSPASKEQTHVK